MDDDPDVTFVMGELLRLMGHDAREAQTGDDALAVAREQRPDLALVDLALRRGDGLEVARRLREEPGGAAIDIVAVSGRRVPPASLALFDDAYVKPIGLPQLAAILAGRRASLRAAAAAAAERAIAG